MSRPSTSKESDRADPAYQAIRVQSIAAVSADRWDALVPRDLPHLRSGFLAAVEASGLATRPYYVSVWRGDEIIGVAVAYVMPVDLLTLAPRKYTRWVDSIRRRVAPRMLYISTIIAGPLITNCHTNFCLADPLSDAERQQVIGALVDSLDSIPEGRAFSFFEFTAEQADRFEPQMTARGFVREPSLPATRLDVHWTSLDEYIASMRKAFRRTVLKDVRAAEGLEFEIVDDFSALADEAWALYRNVLDRAEFVLEELTPAFFRELGKFEQSRLLTARDRATGRLVGIELMMLGDTVLQDLYTGLDYGYNESHRLYFNLLYPVIGFAGEQGVRRLFLGQTSYTFKARLGVTPYPLFIFIKHRSPRVHRFLKRFEKLFFPETPAVSFRVFRDTGADGHVSRQASHERAESAGDLSQWRDI